LQLQYGKACIEVEKTPPVRDEAVQRFHPGCYSDAREDDPSLPPVREKPPPKFVR
jgi:hypothetical protein